MKLKRKWCFALGVITTLLIQLVIVAVDSRYNDYLQECDAQKGYTCNIFGQ